MGVVMCSEHGRSGIALVCSHVGAAVVEREPLPARSIVTVDFVESDVLEPTYCMKCIADAGLPTSPRRMSGEAFERLCETKFNPVPVCVSCFAAANARETPT